MANILSLDQSSRTTGYAVFRDGIPVVISHFDAKSNDLGERLVFIREQVQNLITEYNINEVVFEDIQLQEINGSKEAGLKTFKMLAEVFGVIYETLTEMKIKFSAVPPIVWKATFKIAGKGRAAEKKLAQKYILDNYHMQCTEDEADAACIGLHYIQKQDSEFNWS